VFTPLAKHSKSFNLIDTLAVGVDTAKLRTHAAPGRDLAQTQISDTQVKLIIYGAFVEGKLDAPKSLLSEVHSLYFKSEYPEFSARTMWSFTSAFKKRDPIPQFQSTARVEFLNQLPA